MFLQVDSTESILENRQQTLGKPEHFANTSEKSKNQGKENQQSH